jgi:hypothetical protein
MVFMNLVRKIGNIGDGLKTNMTTTYSDQLAEQRSALLRKAVRQAGLVGLCKSVAKGDVSVSEHELTKLIDEDAQRRGMSFAKLFTANTEEGVTLRKAMQGRHVADHADVHARAERGQS